MTCVGSIDIASHVLKNALGCDFGTCFSWLQMGSVSTQVPRRRTPQKIKATATIGVWKPG